MDLCRGDGLGIFRNMITEEIEQIKKELCSTSKNNDLSVTVKTSLRRADYRDVSFDLT